jgi:hypothetical protein
MVIVDITLFSDTQPLLISLNYPILELLVNYNYRSAEKTKRFPTRSH